MAIAMQFEVPGVTQQQYDQVEEKLRQCGVSLPAAGQLVHVAGPADGGWRTVDVWESREAADRFFRDHLEAIFAEVGLRPDQAPQVFPVHALYGRLP